MNYSFNYNPIVVNIKRERLSKRTKSMQDNYKCKPKQMRQNDEIISQK